MAIQFIEVNHEYAKNTPFAYTALRNVTTNIEMKKMTAIVGATGSGKSTLVQHLNGLLLPSKGRVKVLDHEIVAQEKPKGLKKLRQRVGLVFQFPEMQLFEDTIYKDVSFGPKNFGMSEVEIKEHVENALRWVGIDESLWERSPLRLSGGQKRRVAIAGVLATNPDVIVLDEPTAGLDPQGSFEMMQLFLDLNREHGKTILMVTHDMEHVLHYCDDVLVMDEGNVKFKGTAQSFFENRPLLQELDFVKPLIMQLNDLLYQQGYTIPITTDLSELVGVLLSEVSQ